jgi:hypothetical protein
MTKMTRVWAMPHKFTFAVKPLRDIISRYKGVDELWLDPFAGENSPAEITNDLNPERPTEYHLEALEFIELMEPGPVDGVLFDPPYSLTQVSRSYADIGLKFKGKENPTGGFPKVKDAISRVVRPGGHVISYGWNTVGMGIKRGFELVEVLVCCHGGNRNDTLVVVERKCEAIVGMAA